MRLWTIWQVHNSGRDYDIAVVQKFVDKLETEELKELARQIVTKSLKCGLTEKTINKVYGKGEIPSFAVMLAESYKEKGEKVKGKFYITLKIDGIRCVAIKEKDTLKFFTRKGQPIEEMIELEEEFKAFPNGFVFDGELLLVNKDNLPSDELFRATQKVVRKDGVKKNLEFHMFDVLPLDEFNAGKSKKVYSERREQLESLFSYFADEKSVKHIKLLPVLYQGEDKSVIPKLMEWVDEQGYEGLMLNTANGYYQTKRTDALLKIKQMKSADLIVVSLEEGTGKNAGKLGRINVEYKGSLVGVGSGFSDGQREQFWSDPDEIVGKICEIQFFEESKDEKGNVSLRFPVFKGIRYDKGVDDINYGE